MLLIEMQCEGWEHNRVNAGIIDLCQKAFPNEKISLYAEEKHATNTIKALNKQKYVNMDISIRNIDFQDWRYDNYNCAEKYKELLEDILRDKKEEQVVILLSSNEGIIDAVEKTAKKHLEKSFFIIIHSALESVLYKEEKITIKCRIKNIIRGIIYDLRNGYHAYKRMKENERKSVSSAPGSVLLDCVNKCTDDNVSIILYAPQYEKFLSEKIEKKVLEKFVFLNHPLYELNSYRIPQNNKLTIGIYGQAVNQNAYDIIKFYADKYDNGKVIFHVMTKKDNPIIKLPNVVRMFEDDYVSNEELENARKKLDFIMIPYDDKQYRVTASGILCDALSEEIPVLMLNSPLLKYYSEIKEIGILCDNKKELAHRIAKLAENKNATNEEIIRMRQAEHELKQILLGENVEKMREMLGR